jgi:hypothetical protein
MTGDGAGYDTGVGFHADMERMFEAGWGIEVISWRDHCRRALREWAAEKGVFVALDDHYEYVTFLEGIRSSRSTPTGRRPVAMPLLSPARQAEQRVEDAAQIRIASLEKEIAALREAASLKAVKKARYDKRFHRGGG